MAIISGHIWMDDISYGKGEWVANYAVLVLFVDDDDDDRWQVSIGNPIENSIRIFRISHARHIGRYLANCTPEELI